MGLAKGKFNIRYVELRVCFFFIRSKESQETIQRISVRLKYSAKFFPDLNNGHQKSFQISIFFHTVARCIVIFPLRGRRLSQRYHLDQILGILQVARVFYVSLIPRD